jgi:hypothetical protein
MVMMIVFVLDDKLSFDKTLVSLSFFRRFFFISLFLRLLLPFQAGATKL